MKENMSLLFRESVRIIYPSIGLSGKKDKEFLNAPYFGLGVVEFQKGTVWVRTIGSDEEVDIDLTIYKGVPSQHDLSTSIICVGGFIEVENRGIVIAAGAYKEAELEWVNGLTAVLVALNAAETSTRAVKTVTFFINHFRKRNWSIFSR